MRKKLLCLSLCASLCIMAGCVKNDEKITTDVATIATVVTTTEAVTMEKTTVGETTTKEATTKEATTEEIVQKVYFEDVTDDMFPSLIRGNVYKKQLEFLLGLAKNANKSSGFLATDLDMFVFSLEDPSKSGVQFTPSDDLYHYTCNLAELNNAISAITDDVFADGVSRGSVNGENITFSFYAGGFPSITTKIKRAVVKRDEIMYVEYYCYIVMGGDLNYRGDCTAIFVPCADGMFKLSEIKDGSIDDNIGELDFGNADAGIE